MPDRLPVLPRHFIRDLRARLRTPSGPRSRLRVLTLTHPMLDPGFAYWVVEEESSDD
ncbi:hypothetical protein [Nocardia sp. NBC_00511]|uniref:hypothetical protein n=1 Tax=Nocardia sp. NBC_00511 TaxID=2903591 RepID=UPI0030E18002